jgi:hypothetical protein
MQRAGAVVLLSRPSKDPERVAFFSPGKCEVPFQKGRGTVGSNCPIWDVRLHCLDCSGRIDAQRPVGLADPIDIWRSSGGEGASYICAYVNDNVFGTNVAEGYMIGPGTADFAGN